jgi:hypothetical protein
MSTNAAAPGGIAPFFPRSDRERPRIYLTAPVAGAVLGAGLHHLLYRRFKTRQPLTYKLAGARSSRD